MSLIRGIIALIIGILILGWPQMARGLFVNFLAMYWLSSGWLTVQSGIAARLKKGFWLFEGLLEIVVGVVILLRPVYVYDVAPELALKIAGLIVLAVGLARIFGTYGSRETTREQRLGTLLLGLFEMGLGLILIFLDEQPLAKLFAGGWAFTGGTLLTFQSFQVRGVKAPRSR